MSEQEPRYTVSTDLKGGAIIVDAQSDAVIPFGSGLGAFLAELAAEALNSGTIDVVDYVSVSAEFAATVADYENTPDEHFRHTTEEFRAALAAKKEEAGL